MFLGELVDPATNQRTGEKVELDSSSLTTHGVIVGQTGSGKTGLGIVAIEEALSEGVPCLLIDPKGDLGNLLLTFPGLSAEEFAPWVEGDDPAKVAAQWTEGLASFGIDAARIAALRAKASFTIYTPGSDAGVGLNLIGSLRAPTGAADDPEGRLDEIGSIVSGLLSLMGIDSDPLGSRTHSAHESARQGVVDGNRHGFVVVDCADPNPADAQAWRFGARHVLSTEGSNGTGTEVEWFGRFTLVCCVGRGRGPRH